MPQLARANDSNHRYIIGHRGASGYRPEHTLASYQLAIEQGADFIEPDLVSTKDGVLVARHENEISGTTDVASHSEFADRRATKVIDGSVTTGWFTEDFTLAELQSLRARERLPHLRPGNTAYDGQLSIPTLEEIIRLAQRESDARQRAIGIYPETKHPSYFAAIGLALEEPLVRALHDSGYRGANAPVFIQSFETANLKQLRTLTRLRLVQLVDATGAAYDLKVTGDTRTYADLLKPQGLAELATYADALGVNKECIIPRGIDGFLQATTTVVDDAHAAGLAVHAWTFRAENTFLPADFRAAEMATCQSKPTQAADLSSHGDLTAELKRYFETGLDGVFTDFPDLAVAARAHLST
jgi:glycerophosphoryl diester phosphodiesterase